MTRYFTFIFAVCALSQQLIIDYTTTPVPSLYKPGVFLVVKTEEGVDDFLGNGIHYSALRGISIEQAINHWSVSSIPEALDVVESQRANIELAATRADRLVLPIMTMPLWLSSSSDTTMLIGGWRIYNARPPSDYAVWNALVDSIVTRIHSWGLDPYYEIWNEPDLEYWSGTEGEYFELFRNTYRAIKSADPEARVGGPAVSGFITRLDTLTMPNGFLTDAQLDSTIIGRVIDSCVSWDMPLDFISWHSFGVNLHKEEMLFDYLESKLTESGHGLVPFMVTEWNLPYELRESPLDAAYFINNVQNMVEHDVIAHQVAAWQDFEEDIDEFHKGYGLLSWNGLHKPSWKAMRLLNKMEGIMLDVSPTDYRNLNVLASYNSDTLRIIISNLSLPGLYEAAFHIYFEHHINSTHLLEYGYTADRLDSVMQGLITLPGSAPLADAINSAIPIYRQADSLLENGRDISLKLPGLTGDFAGLITVLDSTRNNSIYRYDSLMAEGFTRSSAIDILYPDTAFIKESTALTDSIYTLHMPPNAVAMIELHIPDLLTHSIEEMPVTNTLVYPNPATAFVELDLSDITQVRIFDIRGRLIETHRQGKFSVAHYSPGVYIMKITTGDGEERVLRLVRE